MINVVELDERINKCLSILDENPRSRIFAALAEAYRRRGDFGRAFSVCKNGLRVHPDYGAAHVVMAKLYLHQNMVGQARQCLERAIEIDGPLRSSDMLMAEIHLLSGEFQEVRKILNRFALEGGEDQAVKNLRERLNKAVRGEAPATPSSPADRMHPASPVTPLADPAATTTPADRETVCTDPAEAVTEIMRTPQISHAAIFSGDGTALAYHNEAGSGDEVNGSEMVSSFAEIERLLGVDEWGPLSAIRIEDRHQQWGILRSDGMLTIILGTARMGYAAAIRKVTQCLRQIADHRPADPESTVLESAAERLPG